MVMTSPDEWAARIGRRLRLKDLHLLMVVARDGSMAKAAHRLSISQPAVSKTVADLEQLLGLRLFDRGPQGVSPTAFGEALLRRSIAVFDELRHALEELDLLAHRTSGVVRIGCNESLAAALLPDVIARLDRDHPGLQLHVAQLPRPITQEARRLRERAVEFIIARGVFAVPEDDLDIEPLFEEPLLIVAGAESRWAADPPRRLDAVRDAPWILSPPEEPPGTLVDDAFRRVGLAPPEGVVAAPSFLLRQQMLARGDWLTVVPRCMIGVFNADRERVFALPIDLGIGLRPVVIYTLRNRTLSPLSHIVIAHLRSIAREVIANP